MRPQFHIYGIIKWVNPTLLTTENCQFLVANAMKGLTDNAVIEKAMKKREESEKGKKNRKSKLNWNHIANRHTHTNMKIWISCRYLYPMKWMKKIREKIKYFLEDIFSKYLRLTNIDKRSSIYFFSPPVMI